MPEGDAGFASLRDLGFHTIVSVDGMKPDVDRAHRFGLRYVHLPIGYDGVPHEQGLKMARAVRDLPGLVYIHCHHGQHRGPASAAAIRRCLDSGCTVEEALALLKRAGTGTQYAGLYAATKEFASVKDPELDQVPADFPEVAAVAGFVKLMVEVDARWDHIKEIKAAGWQTPPGNPDIVPAHEALLLREAFREAARSPDLANRPAELRIWLESSEHAAAKLEDTFAKAEVAGKVQPATHESAFRAVATSCTHCHAKYRDPVKVKSE